MTSADLNDPARPDDFDHIEVQGEPVGVVATFDFAPRGWLARLRFWWHMKWADYHARSADWDDCEPIWPWIAAAVIICALSGLAISSALLAHSLRPNPPTAQPVIESHR